MKTCSKCGESKPLKDYYKHPGGKDGRRGDCKICILKSRRERYETDGQILRDRVRTYQQQNPEKIVAYRQSERVKTAKRGRDRRDYLLRNPSNTPPRKADR